MSKLLEKLYFIWYNIKNKKLKTYLKGVKKMKKQELITKRLKEIETKHNVKIIMAVDNGSNAYGSASPNSDIDLRFLYVETIESYLRLGREKDVIEIIDEENNIEYKGFSLDKFMKLLSKSNPSILEWLNSPINYLENSKYENITKEIKKLSLEYFSVKRCLFHYTGNALTDFKKMLNGNASTKIQIDLKKFLSVFRHLLVSEYIIRENKYPETTDLAYLIIQSKKFKELKVIDSDLTYREFLIKTLETKKNFIPDETNKKPYLIMNGKEYDFHYELIDNLINEYRKVADEVKDKAIDFNRINELYIKWVKELNK